MDVRIGIQHSSRELSFASSLPAAEVQKKVDAALQGSSQTLSLTDEKGTIYVIPTASLAYVEIGSEESRRVGFVA
ncbi:MAG: ATP-binding protein [Candidatus Lumbricidophila eiseniae]|uniref:ATP-binding protein n=1 Tax=Candidatus Lumbricidiphila eiseniae TaxID=1969409 RepID=A0A2A6FQE5_9MICO|nr:MAG: ATP-binding protein [Candidatus Lumbricidophila eiseniae]